MVVLALLAVWIHWSIGGPTVVEWVDDVVTALAALTATVLCLATAKRQHTSLRRYWSLLGAAAACWAGAEVIWGVYDLILHREVPIPSWADVGYLGAIPLTIAALLCHPAMRGSTSRKARSLLDGLVVATALLFLSWTLVLGPVWGSADLSTAEGLVGMAYPFGDVIIVFFIVMAARRMPSGGRRSMWFLLGGLFAMALADSTYTYLSTVKGYETGNLVDTGWVIGYLGIAMAAAAAPAARPQSRARFAEGSPKLGSLVAPLLPVFIALAVATAQIQLGDTLDTVSWASLIALIGLVLVRQALLMLELIGPRRSREDTVMHRLTHAALSTPAPETPEPAISGQP